MQIPRRPLAIITITPRTIFDLLKIKIDDSFEYRGAWYDSDTDTFRIKIMHPDFPDVADGACLPRRSLISHADGTITLDD